MKKIHLLRYLINKIYKNTVLNLSICHMTKFNIKSINTLKKLYARATKILLIVTIFSMIVMLASLIFSDTSIFHIVQAEEIIKVVNTKKTNKWFWRWLVVGGVIITAEAICWWLGYFDEEIIEIVSDTEI